MALVVVASHLTGYVNVKNNVLAGEFVTQLTEEVTCQHLWFYCSVSC